MFHVKHYFYIVFSVIAKLYLNAVTFGDTFFNLVIIQMPYLNAVGAFGANRNHNLTGFAGNIGNVADELYLPHIFPRAVELAGIKALYGLGKNIFTHFKLSETELENAKIGIVHYYTACHNGQKQNKSAKALENQG